MEYQCSRNDTSQKIAYTFVKKCAAVSLRLRVMMLRDFRRLDVRISIRQDMRCDFGWSVCVCIDVEVECA
jgi:hypothetical protein